MHDNMKASERTTDRYANPLYNLSWVILIVSLLLAILLHAYFGFFSRYIADDYCSAASFKSLGFFQAQINRHLTWDGRFSFTFFITFFALLGERTTIFIPGLSIFLWIITSYYFLYQLFKKIFTISTHGLALLISLSYIFISIYSLPSISEDVYWLTGNTTYLFPIIFELFLFGFVLQSLNDFTKMNTFRKVLFFTLIFIISFINSGFSEVSTTIHVTICGILSLVSLFISIKQKKPNKFLAVTSVILLGSLLGFLYLFTAPGNTIRMGPMNFASRPGFVELIINSIKLSTKFAFEWFTEHMGFIWPVLLTVMIYPIVIKMKFTVDQTSMKRLLKLVLLSAVVLAVILVIVTFIPGYWVSRIAPPERVLILPISILTITFLVISFGFGLLIGNENLGSKTKSSCVAIISLILCGIICLTVPIYTAREYYYENFQIQKEFAQKWDRQNLDIIEKRNDGQLEIITNSATYPLANLERITGDVNYWTNQCASQYYEVDEILGE